MPTEAWKNVRTSRSVFIGDSSCLAWFLEIKIRFSASEIHAQNFWGISPALGQSNLNNPSNVCPEVYTLRDSNLSRLTLHLFKVL